MITWIPLDTGGPPKYGKAFTSAGKAAKSGAHVAMYFTPERGWYGWVSCDELPTDRMERIYPVLSCDCGQVAVAGSVILKAADAIRLEAPDEV